MFGRKIIISIDFSICFSISQYHSTYIFPLRSRLNNLPDDPDAAADAAENDANDPDDNAFSPGVPEFDVP